MKMQNPAEAWGDDMGNNSSSEVVIIPAYIRQTMLESENGPNLFNKIGLLICNTHRKEFVKGWIDLDYWWQNSQDPKIIRYRNSKMLTPIKTPFCGRKVYLVRIIVDKAKDENKERTGEPVFGDLKATSRGYYLTGQINIFHNEELGWEKTKVKEEMIDGAMEKVEVANDSNEFLYNWMSFFPTSSCGKRMEEEIQPYIKLGAIIYAYFLGNVTIQPGKTRHNMNVYDHIWMSASE